VVLNELKLMGEAVYECDVPTGYSDEREAWLDPGVMVYRWNFALKLVGGKLNGVKVPAAFFEPLARAPAAQRPRAAAGLVLRGRPDPALEPTLARTPDPHVLVALALGSPNFQQQ
jgi:hypothetical protein